MRSSRASYTRGMSLVSTLIFLIAFGFAVIIAGRLVPLYFEFQGVSQTLEHVSQAGSTDALSIRLTLERGFSTANVTTIKAADVDVERKDGEVTVTADYDAVAPFMGNVGFVVHFHKAVKVAGAPQS